VRNVSIGSIDGEAACREGEHIPAERINIRLLSQSRKSGIKGSAAFFFFVAARPDPGKLQVHLGLDITRARHDGVLRNEVVLTSSHRNVSEAILSNKSDWVQRASA
jgi:hypothetical protein